jgi:hypothetical protein
LPIGLWKQAITTVPVYGGIECTKGSGQKNLTRGWVDFVTVSEFLFERGHPGRYVAAKLPRRLRRRWRAAVVGRHTHRQHKPPVALVADVVQHLPDPLDQRVHPGDAVLG